MEGQLERFQEKFGREPGQDDPIFFDPDEDTPQVLDIDKVRAQIVMTMIKSNIPRSLIYAYLRTGGMMLSDENRDNWPKTI